MGGVMQRLQGKVAIVTGAGVGIGEASAKRLAAEGAKVVVADINEVGATRVAQEIVAGGGDAFAHHVDLADEDSIIALYRVVREHYGRIDIVHNNAADTRGEQISRDMGIADMDAAIWDRAFTVNTRGTMLMIKHALPMMLSDGGGSIINTSSGAGLTGDLFAPAYAASKAAVNCLTMYVATQYGKHKIRCNVVSPGLVLTPTARANSSPDTIKGIERHSLTPYLGEPEDIAAAVAFLASDDAKFVNAQVMVVDGGYTNHMPHVADSMTAFEGSPDRRPG
jgi:NAD(P)-dependent dehydrogenase (short-subunit alcohol dehydrogenase family)